MRLYLMRHGEAELGPIDDERTLSREGRASAARAATALARLDPGIRRILHSGKRRARETAEILASGWEGSLPVVAAPGLGPEDDPARAAEALLADSTPTLVVGHLPHLARLASLLTTGDPDRAIVRMPAGTLLALSQDDGRWRIETLLSPKLLERLGLK
jgi:phosphohistidine phosphatase